MEEYPKCKLCELGVLLPMETPEASAWVCNNPACGFYMILRKDGLEIGRKRMNQEDEEKQE